MPMLLVGFVGAVLLLVGNLGTPYSGGYLALRILPFGSSLTGLLAAALLAFLAAIVVVVAAALPRSIGQALLAGTALAAAVPSITAVVAVLTGAPTSLSPVVWWGLAGAVILAGSGLLARRRTRRRILVGVGRSAAAGLADHRHGSAGPAGRGLPGSGVAAAVALSRWRRTR